MKNNFKRYDFNRKSNPYYEKHMIDFLNSPLVDFYNGKIKLSDIHYEFKFKGQLLGLICDIERVLKGTFCCGLSLENIDEEVFNEMFPNACNIFKQFNDRYLENMSYFLKNFRNANAHVFPGRTIELLNDFKIDLSSQKKFRQDINYNVGSQLTIAGAIFILLNFLREKSIEKLTTSDYLSSLVSCGKSCRDKGERFVKEISNVNLEVEISRRNNFSVLGAIFGDSYFQNQFELYKGDEDFPLLKIKGSYLNGKLTIDKNSVSKTYYNEDYELVIKDEKLFIDQCNRFPPMVFVDVLHFLKIDEFDETTLSKIEGTGRDITRLNKPKFYIDKTIQILFAPSSASDLTKMSNILNMNLTTVLLNLEHSLIKTHNIRFKNDYSKLTDILRIIKVPDLYVADIRALRSFAFHGYKINEPILINDIAYTYDYSFVIKTLSRLLNIFKFKKENHADYDALTKNIDKSLIIPLVRSKYYQTNRRALEVLDEELKGDLNNLFLANGWVENSSFDINIFNRISNKRKMVYKTYIKDFDYPLYILDEKDNLSLVKKYADKNNLNIIIENDDNILADMILK